MRTILIRAAVLAVIVSPLAAQEAGETTYRGKVADANGQPLAGAKVNGYAVAIDPITRFTIREIGSAVTTGADGTFLITEKGPTKTMAVIATARKEGLACGWADWERGMRRGGQGEIVITLGPPAALFGVVVDEAGKPIAGATVYPLLQTGPQERSQHMIGLGAADWLIVKTDANGFFRLPNMPADTQAIFLVEAPGKATLAESPHGPQLDFSAEQKDIKVILKAEGRIEGTLVQKDGKPIAGQLVAAQSSEGDEFSRILNKPVATDKDGKFSLGGLDEGDYSVTTVAGKGTPEFIASKDEIKVVNGKTTSGVKVEARAGGLLGVLVVDDKGKPIPGAMVYVMQESRGGSYSPQEMPQTDANGTIALRVEPGDYRAHAQAEGYTNAGPSGDPTTVEEGKTVLAKIELKPLTKIKGIVRDPEGKPVAGAVVTAVGPGGGRFSFEIHKTDANGRFQVLCGDVMVMSSDSEKPPAAMIVVRHAERALAAAVEVKDPNKDVEITLKTGIVLKGVVVGEDGKPIAKAKVTAADPHSPSYGSDGKPDAVTDEKGQYQIKGLPPGLVMVTAQAEGFGTSSAQAEAEEGKKEIEAEKITLKAAKFTISGIVKDANDAPVAGATIFVYGEGQSRTGIVKTDKDGKFKVDKLVEGKVSISASARGLRGSAEADAGEKDVEVIVSPPDREPRGPRRGKGTEPKGEDF